MRIDEYTPPTSWDDLEMDWTNPDCRDARYVNALILALYERYAAISIQIFGDGAPLPYPTLPTVSPDQRIDYTKLISIHNATMNLLMPGVSGKRFVPYYLNPDNYFKTKIVDKSGSDYSWGMWNAWNLHDIMESIGDTIILYPQPYYLNNNAWLLQQYKIINKLNTIPVFWSSTGTQYTREVLMGEEGTIRDNTYSVTIINGASMSKSSYSSNITGYTSKYSVVKLYPHVRPFPIEILGYVGIYDGEADISEVFPDISINGYYFTALSKSILANEQGEIDLNIGDSSLISHSGESKDMSMSFAPEPTQESLFRTSGLVAKFNFSFQD